MKENTYLQFYTKQRFFFNFRCVSKCQALHIFWMYQLLLNMLFTKAKKNIYNQATKIKYITEKRNIEIN